MPRCRYIKTIVEPDKVHCDAVRRNTRGVVGSCVPPIDAESKVENDQRIYDLVADKLIVADPSWRRSKGVNDVL